MSLYISGTLNIFAIIEEDKYKKIYNIKDKINELSKKYNLYVDINSVNDGCDTAFIIHNQKKGYDCFYSGDVFEYDMSIPDDDTFSSRVTEFLNEFNSNVEFKEFHNLVFNLPKKRYFVIS